MERRDKRELNENYSDPAWRDRFTALFSLRELMAAAVVAPGFLTSDDVANAIVLSEAGEVIFAQTHPRIAAEVPESDLRLAIFVSFCFDELFIDTVETDYDVLWGAIDAWTIGKILRYPWIYGRRIDDEYRTRWTDYVKTLPHADATALLDSTGQGVFQLDRALVGPFGLLRSLERRALGPARFGPMMGCSDLSCWGLHPIELETGNTAILMATSVIGGLLRSQGRRQSAWETWYQDILLPNYTSQDDFNASDLPLFLGNALSKDELCILTAAVIASEGARIRHLFPDKRRFAQKLGGSANDIANRLSEPELLQILLLTTDSVLIEQLDRLVEEQHIAIPATEVRNPVISRVSTSSSRMTVEMSSLGVRIESRRGDVGVARLQRLLMTLYSSSDGLEDLGWKLRNVEGDSPGAKVAKLVRTAEPQTIIRDMVLESPAMLRRAFQQLRFGYFPMPSSEPEEQRLIDRLLWKLGFPMFVFPQYQSLFWTRLDQFEQIAERFERARGEAEKDTVRRESVNLFVSVEEVLDLSLSFSTWALLFDHYGAPHLGQFAYNRMAARGYMAAYFNGMGGVDGPTGKILLDPDGINTMDPLIQGLSMLADEMEELARSANAFVRPPENVPWYASTGTLERFPFVHVHPFLDLDGSCAAALVAALRRVVGLLRSGNVASVRNRIDHKREDFPTREEMIATANTLRLAVEELEVQGLLPSVFQQVETTTDRYHRSRLVLADYKGREFCSFGPSEFARARTPEPREVQVIFAGARIADAVDVLRFRYREPSSYQDRWEDYPPRLRTSGPLPTVSSDSVLEAAESLPVGRARDT